MPFRTSSDDRLFVITHECWYFLETVTRREFVLLVPLSALLPKVLDKMARGTSREESDDRVIPWAEWGPQGTRMMDRTDIQLSDVWVCYVHGMKVIGRLSHNRAIIYDFGHLDMLSMNTTGLIFDSDRDGDLFSSKVVTRRPFRVMTFTLPRVPDGRHYEGIMLSEDAILTVSVKELCIFFHGRC